MAATILSPTAFFLLLVLHTRAQIPTLIPTPVVSAPPAPPPINLTATLDEVGQFTTFIRLLTSTQVANQVDYQLHISTKGVTVFAPTDNAFNILESGTLNSLSEKGQVQLAMYHVLPKFYTWNDLLFVSNPVMTLATGQDGLFFGLNFTSQGNQFNVSSGVVEAEIDNALRKDFPLAIYQVDKVLLPEELFSNMIKSPSMNSLTPVINSTVGSENTTVVEASHPSADSTPDDFSAGIRIKSVGLVVIGGLICMGLLF